jgi:hypothetical protein
MNPGFAIAAGVIALIGLICLWFWKKFRDEVALMAATPIGRAADIAKAASGTLVAVAGIVRCAAPISGEFSKQRCVYAKSEIEREEVTYRDGKRETRWVNERTTERHAPFEVEDASGRVTVNAEGASVEAVEVYNQSGNTVAEDVLSIGLSLLGAGRYDRRFKEHILAPDIPVYVLGTTIAGGGIGAAPRGAKVKEFLITYKSEAEREKSSGRIALIMLIIAIVLFAGALWALWAAFKYPA